MTESSAPRVGFRYRTDTGDSVRIGYLLTVSGRHYLATTLEQVRENPFLARLPELDPSLLKERPKIGAQVTEYLYLGEIPFLQRE